MAYLCKASLQIFLKYYILRHNFFIEENRKNIEHYSKMYKQKAAMSMKKKKKVSYLSQLQKQVSPKSAKDSQIQVTWVNTQGAQCKRIIQPNRCFCTHSFQCHETAKTIGAAFCLAPGCKCKCYQYVPYYYIKCMCRHSYKDHDINSRMCKMCNKCLGFVTNWSCKCGFKYDLHQTVFQLKKKKSILKSQRIGEGSNTVLPYQNTSNIRQCQHNKQNKEYSFDESNSMDARTYELNKFNLQLNIYTKNESKMEEHRRKQLQRINQKYGNINFETQIDNSQSQQLQWSRIRKPNQARNVTPLQLYIRPHNYQPVKLQKFLEKQYRKYEEKYKYYQQK